MDFRPEMLKKYPVQDWQTALGDLTKPVEFRADGLH